MKGTTVLKFFPHIDMVWSCPVESMHCCFLGVARQFVSLWTDSVHKDEAWYLGTAEKLQLLDRRLQTIKPPHNMDRRPPLLSNLAYWNGTFASQLISAGRVVLIGVLQPMTIETGPSTTVCLF